MSKEMRADFFPNLLKMSEFKGQLVAIPWFTDCRALFYRKDLLAAEGIPEPTTSWTWDQFLTYAKKLTKDLNGDGIIDQYGFGTSGRYGSQRSLSSQASSESDSCPIRRPMRPLQVPMRS